MPPGLVISKLGIQAYASGDAVTGMLCLKVGLDFRRTAHLEVSPTKDFDRSRHVLLTSPQLSLSHPEIRHVPLNAPLHSSRLPYHVTAAARLLNLPIARTESKDSLPDVQVSSSGQVSLVCRTRASSFSRTPEWLITIPFETQVQRANGNTYRVRRLTMLRDANHSLQVNLALPKCLDNVIRFQICSPSPSASLGEVSILTEPRMLPLPPISEVDDDDETDEEGSWLEGRFQR